MTSYVMPPVARGQSYCEIIRLFERSLQGFGSMEACNYDPHSRTILIVEAMMRDVDKIEKTTRESFIFFFLSSFSFLAKRES